MKILTNENKSFDLNNLGRYLTHDISYGVFDISDKENPDYFFKPLVMTETFNSVAIDLQIENYRIKLPGDWSIILADPETAEIEVMPIEEINSRNFKAFVYNPISGYMPGYKSIKPVDIFTDVYWVFPRLSLHNFLVVPLSDNDISDCIFVVNERDQKKLPSLELTMML